jgi:hypothetical protein
MTFKDASPVLKEHVRSAFDHVYFNRNTKIDRITIDSI